MNKAKITEEYDNEKLEALDGDDEYVIGYNNGLEDGKDLALWLFKEQQVDDAMKLLQTQQQWISVEDSLPPDDQMVIGYTPVDGYMFVGFHKTHKYSYIDTSHSCWYIITSMRSTKHMHKKVTHWMPLPEPPEVTQDG